MKIQIWKLFEIFELEKLFTLCDCKSLEEKISVPEHLNFASSRVGNDFIEMSNIEIKHESFRIQSLGAPHFMLSDSPEEIFMSSCTKVMEKPKIPGPYF